MPDTKLSAITNISAPGLTDLVYGEQGGTEFSYPLDRLLAVAARWTVGGRLSLQTGVAVPTTDQGAKTTLYYTPYLHDEIGLYDGTRWRLIAINETSLALSGLTAGKNYDAFVDWNAGSPSLVLGPAWTNDTTRATALTTQNNIQVLTGTLTSRYVGTIRATAATTTEDTLIQRYVWNFYNQVPRKLFKQDGTGHTYAVATVRQWNATAADKVEFVLGLAGQTIPASCWGDVTCGGTGFPQTGLALDSITVMSNSGYHNPTVGTPRLTTFAPDLYIPAAGYHYIAMLENEAVAATSTFNIANLYATLLG